VRVKRLPGHTGRFLVVGVDTVSIAKSARSAGFDVCAADYFGDLDLRSACSDYKSIINQKQGKSSGRMGYRFRTAAFLRMAQAVYKQRRIDAIVLASGLDDDFRVLNELSRIAPILGNSPRVIREVRERQKFFSELVRLGIDCPETAVVESIDEAEAAATRIGFPVVVKVIEGFAGMNIGFARSSEEIERVLLKARDLSKGVLIQELVDGIHASISFLCTENDVEALTVSEQLLGSDFLFSHRPFGYCGNLVPLDASDLVLKKCEGLAKKIGLHFGLKGSNGIDVVISRDDKPYVIEVNPRFQGTLECVERVLGINLVEAHVDACLQGSLPNVKEKTGLYCTRLILYAPERVRSPDLTGLPDVRDVPLPKSIIEKGEPLCSVLADGDSRDASFGKAKTLAESVYAMLRSADFV
jgi:predicted ATP-grasp superfamily ATP-dependent carboligase